MNIYYHKTDGGAEYLSTTYVKCPNGHKEGTMKGAFARIDGGDFELFPAKLKALGFEFVRINGTIVEL